MSVLWLKDNRIGRGMQHSLPKNVLLRCASCLHDDPREPVFVAASTFAFLHRIERHCRQNNKALGHFLQTLQLRQLSDAVLRNALTSKCIDSRNELTEELQRWQLSKAQVCANGDFERAAALRETTNALEARIIQLCPQKAEIEPDHFLKAIAHLGFDQSVLLNF